MTETYYSLLNIDENASEETINQAYRDLVKETHPDVNDDPRARERMAELTQARDVLTDDEKRARYDAKHDISSGPTQDTGQRRTTSTQNRNRTREDTHTRQSHGWSSEASTARDSSSSSGSARDSRSQHQRRRTTRTKTQNRTHSQTTSRAKTKSSVPVWIRLRYLPQQTREFVTSAVKWFIWVVLYLLFLGFFGDITWKRIRSALVSKTAIRLTAGFALWWGLSHFSRSLGAQLGSPNTQVLLVIMGFLGSYLGYDLVIRYTGWGETRLRGRFQPNDTTQLWPIVVVNLFGMALVFWGLSAGAPLGGFGFAIAATIAFIIFMFLFGWGIGLFIIVVGGEVSDTLLQRGVVWEGVLAPILSAAVLFTSYGRGIEVTITQLLRDTPASVYPWVGPGLVGQIGPIYGDVLVNFILGSFMLGAFSWSLVQLYRTVAQVSWDDRFSFGYRITPGVWHFLITIPAVIIVWMILENVYVIPIAIGTTTASVTIDHMIGVLGVSPAWITGLYILRRQVEPFLQRSVWTR